jgi:pyridoxal phosphate enzyme (YggS family)
MYLRATVPSLKSIAPNSGSFEKYDASGPHTVLRGFAHDRRTFAAYVHAHKENPSDNRRLGMTLQHIREQVAKQEAASGRALGSTTLIAVSKVQPDARVKAILDQGHRVFGENRVQEAAGKWPAFRESYDGIVLHLIGPLQTNKARQAMELAQAIHTLDRPKLAAAIARLAQEMGACPDLFVQVNTGEEPQKAGVLPADADGFIKDALAMDLPVRGLMCIPPVDEEPSLHFALLAKIAARNGLAGLSMGMSSDFERAIALGATHIRVGSAIFGERVPA